MAQARVIQCPSRAVFACAALLATLASASTAAQNEDKVGSSKDDWQIVQSYIDERAAWVEQRKAISLADVEDKEKQRRREQQGPAPDRLPAVQAAKEVVEAGGERVYDALGFLLRHDDQELAMFALSGLVGPDWSVVRDYVEAAAGKSEHAESSVELDRAPSAPPGVPRFVHATAAALNILNSIEHENRREAAEFLIEYGETWPGEHIRDHFEYPYVAAVTLSSDYPDYDQWPVRLHQLRAKLGSRTSGRDFDELNTFIASLAALAGDPAGRATARYFTALLLLERADDEYGRFPVEKRRAWRKRALELARGLSVGVADRELTVAHRGVGTARGQTYADLEADILDMIHTTTLGGNASGLAGRRLDGSGERLSAYKDRLLLLDFWATWCGPCIKAFPDLRELAAKYAEDLRILAVSVDDEVETVLEFLAETSTPWENWHVDKHGDFVRQWRVSGYPTYVLLGRGGVVLNRYSLTPMKVIEADIDRAIRSSR
ncbi:MAG: TlpA disulfide reductase family protein [Gammaproteobacteria bacterium]|nr:TlpA disulfide reductase family protein [Gammaproteobacteria bacterium]